MKKKKNIKEKKNVVKEKKTSFENENNEVYVKPKRKRKFRFWYWLLVVIVACALLVFLGGIGFCYYIVKSAPEFNIEEMFEKEATRIFAANGVEIAKLGTEKREKVKYEDLPQVLIDAIIATEDSRFFQHNGFDAPRFIKASITQVLGQGGGGASTLTMQLSKLSFTSTESSGIEGIIRKFTDIYMSVFQIEQNLTKEEIIEYYVNTPCMGGNIYGVQQASKYYFGKDVKDLNLVEAAQIAGMFQSPNGYNPYFNPNDANARKNTVLYLMKRHGYITDAEYEAGIAVEIKDFIKDSSSEVLEYQGFIDTVVQEVIDKTGNNPYSVPMDIYTTMIPEKQDVINNFYKTWKFKDNKIETGIAVVDNKTGALIAVGAGRNKKNAMTLNIATFSGQTKRAGGSTMKPIMDYGPAIEYANLSTYGPFIDEATTYGGSVMRNFNGKYNGFMSMRDCLKNSVNTCALQAFRLTTNDQKYKFATSLGIEFDSTFLPDSYSIGTFNAITPVTLAGAYAAFGNGGYYTEPYSFTKIVYRETEETYEPDIQRKRVMKPQTAYIISSILVNATSSRVSVKGTQVATKTGTTSYDEKFLKKYKLSNNVIPDSWTASYSPDYAIAIWYGYVDGLDAEAVKNKYYITMSHATNERTKIQGAIGNKIYEKNSKFKNPGGIVSSEVELETIPAQLPSENTPADMRGKFLFISGTEPSDVSTRYSKLQNPTNLSYSVVGNQLNLSWTSIPTPDAIDTNYLTDYFNNGYGEWASDYLAKRLAYNNSKIGTVGYEIYLTNGSDSTYVGFTENSNYSIDLSTISGTYDGVIVKSAYTIFKGNSSSGTKVSFTIGNITSGIDESKVSVTMNSLNTSLKVGSTYNKLTSSNIDTIKYDGLDIKNEVVALNVQIADITKDGAPLSAELISSSAGTATVKYKVTFSYKNTNITKTFTQTVNVTN